MSFVRNIRLHLVAAFLAAGISSSHAAAHDAPVALMEAIADHNNICASGLAEYDATLLGPAGWVKKGTDADAIVNKVTQAWLAKQKTSLFLFFERKIGEFRVMLLDMRYTDGDITERQCFILIPDLPFMPSGDMLEFAVGAEATAGSENSPGSLRDLAMIWEERGPQHLRTLARYTNSYTGQSDLPEDVIYPGFYITTIFSNYKPKNKAEAP